MSYCRWSSDNGYCDVYVYEDVHGGWTTHVCTMRHPSGRPNGYLAEFGRQITAGGDIDQDKLETARTAQQDWDALNPATKIDHAAAGESYNHDTPGECADRLEWLRGEGFHVPQYAVDTLREEDIEVRLDEYYTPSEIQTWLTSNHPQLEGQRPCDLIKRGEYDKVHEVLDRLDSAGYL